MIAQIARICVIALASIWCIIIISGSFLSVNAQQPLPNQFTVYDYKNGRPWSVSQLIDPESYNILKNDDTSNSPACITCDPGSNTDTNKAHTQRALEKALGTWPMIKLLADQLRAIS